MSSSMKGLLPLKVIFHQRSSSVKGRLLSKVVFCKRSSSVKGCLLSKVVFHQRSSSVKVRLPSKVVFHQRSSSIKCDKVSQLLDVTVLLDKIPPCNLLVCMFCVLYVKDNQCPAVGKCQNLVCKSSENKKFCIVILQPH